MIYFKFSLDSPFRDTSAERDTKDYFYYDEPIKFWKHKYLSLQVSKFGYGNIFNFGFDFPPRGGMVGRCKIVAVTFRWFQSEWSKFRKC